MRVTHLAATIIACTSLVACNRQVEVVSGGEVAPAVPANANMLPAGTTLNARLNNTLSTETTKPGDTFTLTVTENVVAQNGDIVVPAGAVIEGRVTGIDRSSDPTDKAYIQLELNTLRFGGRSYPFSASVQRVSSVEERNPSTGAVIQRAGQGAALGAAIGAIVSGAELDAILKGGAIGAATGAVIALGAGNVEHRIPAGATVTLRTNQNVALR